VEKFSNKRILNFVARLSFKQTTEVIKNSDVLLCCDGGLMHAAAAVNAKLIPLLARLPLNMLMTHNVITYDLYNRTNVNNIKSNEVYQKYSQFLNSFDNHHLDV
jgi:ADP-heptose:LPS heptosyltransferase